jgi:ADP-heptose:LPS heptosyltransferase
MISKGILVYRLGSMGDGIMALPAFHAIRRSFPGARIGLLTNKPVSSRAASMESLLGNTGLFDEFLAYPAGTRNPIVLACLLLKIRLRRFETVFNLTEYRSTVAGRRDQFFFRLAGCKSFHGFRLDRMDKTPVPDPLTGQVEWEASRLARRVGSVCKIDLDDPSLWNLRLGMEERSRAASLLAEIPDGRRIAAFSVGTKLQSNHWGPGNWMDLSERLARKLNGWSVVFIGSLEDSEQSKACLVPWKNSGLDLCGKTSPRVSAAILERCSFFVGHDSGPMHLAACLGIPCVGIFSARNLPRRWFPRGSENEIVQHLTECAGCELETCIAQRKKCILGISVDEVEAAVFSLIRRLGAD